MQKLFKIILVSVLFLSVGAAVFAAQTFSKKEIVVQVTRSFSGDDFQPNGFVVSLDGWTASKSYVAEQLPALPSPGLITEAKNATQVGTLKMYHAGAYDYFTVIRVKDTLQVIREEAEEMSPTKKLNRHVVLSVYVPSNIKVRVQQPK